MKKSFFFWCTSSLPFLICVALFAGGCKSVASTFPTRSNAPDSLQTENEFLWNRLAMLSDSVAFYRSIDTGGYAREARRKDEKIAELTYHLEICEDGGLVVAEELVDDLFQPASADLTEEGVRRLSEIIPALNDPRFGSLRIESHSDNSVPGPSIVGRYPSNWELSGARSAAIARMFVEAYGMDPAKVVVVSRGASMPKYDNTTAEGRRHNRRVEFIVYYTAG